MFHRNLIWYSFFNTRFRLKGSKSIDPKFPAGGEKKVNSVIRLQSIHSYLPAKILSYVSDAWCTTRQLIKLMFISTALCNSKLTFLARRHHVTLHTHCEVFSITKSRKKHYNISLFSNIKTNTCRLKIWWLNPSSLLTSFVLNKD